MNTDAMNQDAPAKATVKNEALTTGNFVPPAAPYPLS